MRVMDESGTPGVQYRDEAGAGAKMLEIGPNCQRGLGRDLEQQIVDHGFILIGDIAELGRQRVDHMKIRHWQQLGLTLGQPLARSSTLTLGAMAVAAGIAGDERVRAVFTACNMAGIGTSPCRPVVAEDVRDLQLWTEHCCRWLGRRLLMLRLRLLRGCDSKSSGLSMEEIMPVATRT
jgi:hypothetical protein